MKVKQTPIDAAVITAFPHNIPQKATEASAIRNALKLKTDTNGERWVYTTIHGTGTFRWFKITQSVYDWYKQNFRDIEEIIEQ
jgi:hypothetical protein